MARIFGRMSGFFLITGAYILGKMQFMAIDKDRVDSLRDKVVQFEDSLFTEKNGTLYKAVLEKIEKPLIEHILEKTGGNQLKASRILGINRNTMRAKIKKLAIDVSRWKI